MALKGNIKTMPLADILRFIASGKNTGTFELNHGTAWKRLYFEKGLIISAGSSDPSEYLGHFLISENKITEEQLTQALDVQKKTRVMIGKILVMIGAIEETDLVRLLEVKCKETLFSMFLWPEAEFEFFENQLPAVRMIPASLQVEPMVLEGLRRREDWKVVHKQYPSRDITFVKEPSASLPPDVSAFIRNLFDLIDGKRTVGDLILQSHSTEYKVFFALDLLHKLGLVKVNAFAAAEAPRVFEAFALSNVVANGKSKLETGRFEEAINLFNYVLQYEENQEARDLLSRAEHALVESIYSTTISPDAIPRLSRPLESLMQEKFSSEESFIVTRINGHWDMKSILTITPLREVDALRIIKRLIDRRIVEL